MNLFTNDDSFSLNVKLGIVNDVSYAIQDVSASKFIFLPLNQH